MIMNPAIIALFAGSLIVALMVLFSVFNGVRILRYWDLKSGSEVQLNLERQTYLISTIMSYAFCFQLFSFFLFIFTADSLSGLFTGAMCAAGTLNVNGFGYPALLLKVVNFILGGVWLVVNYVDNRAIDYPLIKKKYIFLLVIAPFVLAETVLQGAYFLNLNAHVITSCCGSLFSPEGKNVGAVFIALLPTIWMKIVFYASLFFTGVSGLLFYRQGRPAMGFFFAFMGVMTFIVSVASLISFISLYFYQLPTHHCPFCLLQKEYHYMGYLLYITLLGGAVGGTAIGALIPARQIPSLRDILPVIERRLTVATVLFYFLFTVIVSCVMVFTNFKLEGY